jgi:hypothetical protein
MGTFFKKVYGIIGYPLPCGSLHHNATPYL